MKNTLISKINDFFMHPIVLFLGAGLILRLFLARYGTLELDQNTFIAWSRMLSTQGLSNFYSNWSDYLPGYLYVLFILAKIKEVLPVTEVVLYKLPAILADLSSAILVYKIVAREKSQKLALLAASLILFNPAFLANSTFWGQVDSLTAFFSVLAIYLLPRNKFLSALTLAIGAAIKPQAALAAPLILYLFYKNKMSFVELIKYVLVSSIFFALIFVPFYGASHNSNLLEFIFERISKTIGQYPYGSVNAFNFWALWGFWQKENVGIFSEKNIGIAIFAGVSVLYFLKNKSTKMFPYKMLGILLLSNFLFFTRMHERHMLPSLMPFAVAAAFSPTFFIIFCLFSLTYVLNMYYAYLWITENFREVFGSMVVTFVIFLNIVSLFVAFVSGSIDKKIKGIPGALKLNKFNFSVIKNYFTSFINSESNETVANILSPRTSKICLLSIIVFAFLARVIMLHEPTKEYFDEVYHAFTAQAILNSDNRAWEWWNENPEGFAFEWTHPPLAKEIMYVGMKVFGQNAFGWRFPGAVFGTISVYLVYLLGKRLFGRDVGVLAAFLFSLDGLFLVLSRIGMNDIYLITFLLGALVLFWDKKYFWSSIALGLAMSSKWSAFWFYPVLGVTYFLFAKRKWLGIPLAIVPSIFFFSVSSFDEPSAKIFWSIFFVIFVIFLFGARKKAPIGWLVFVPLLVYILSYVPLFVSGHGWDIFWGMQRQMWWYHTGLVATHPYTSGFWTWPLLLRPIWLYTSGEVLSGKIGNIYAMGNPAIFWGGFAAVITSLYDALLEKRKKLLLSIFGYIAVFVPWALSPRIMFLYHYFPALPFMALCLACVLYKSPKLVLLFLALSLVFFVYFYPHWTGILVPKWMDNSYYWLPGWR